MLGGVALNHRSRSGNEFQWGVGNRSRRTILQNLSVIDSQATTTKLGGVALGEATAEIDGEEESASPYFIGSLECSTAWRVRSPIVTNEQPGFRLRKGGLAGKPEVDCCQAIAAAKARSARVGRDCDYCTSLDGEPLALVRHEIVAASRQPGLRRLVACRSDKT
jgi:hypothetical protein